MNEQELAIAKKIAEIEGVEYRIDTDAGVKTVSTLKRWIEGNKKCCTWSEYNPFCWSILGPLMVKHEVVPDYEDKEICIPSVFICDKFDPSIPTTPTVMFDGTEEGLKRAILECIIKSKEV